jgi:hypothetical protein
MVDRRERWELTEVRCEEERWDEDPLLASRLSSGNSREKTSRRSRESRFTMSSCERGTKAAGMVNQKLIDCNAEIATRI